ncbi:DUF2572 family protein [Oceanirhabdus sp. W0125-5]|uniref:DUF2572 family protein n=1 Tax=Oceanirhabdus sp. W0125-5 TaxID=2999116 RepID=UPI0022F32BAE|nr:DUF2572 family protein [Oceanirhabdus sp. W0125-5]WBW99589.1 DUF2572 family protein [Oceanirhabdus sp. W0125-5]
MRKKRGSILIYVMAIFAVLMIMGATLSALTIQSMKNRKYYSTKRVNLYYSESGIDEAYGIASEYVNSAYNYALNETNKIIGEVIISDKVILEKVLHMKEKPGYNVEEVNNEIKNLKLFNEDGKLSAANINDKQDELFKEKYIKFFNDNMSKLIDDLERDTYSAGDSGSIEVKVSDHNITVSDEFLLNIVSTFSDQGIEKSIAAEFKFITPEYGSKISFPSEYTVFSESPVWNKGLVVNQTLRVGNGTYPDNKKTILTVNGDVYVKGKDKSAIIMNSHNSELKVKSGKVIACEGVKFDYDSENNKSEGANFTISDGSLYTKKVLFNKDSSHTNGAEGALLDVRGSLYVLDDCEINSEKATLTVGDSYYGVSSGEDSNDNKIDNSSSIIINAEDLGDEGSSVTISGKVYLAGTSYIMGLYDPLGNDKYNYQTGESISIKGNYKAYTGSLKRNPEIDELELKFKYELEKTMLSPLLLSTHYNKYSKWFTIYENKIFLGMDKRLIDRYAEEGIYSYKIDLPEEDVPEVENSTFSIGHKESLDSSYFNSIKNNKFLSINLIKSDSEINIKVPILQKNVEAFLLGKDNVFVTMTPKGEMEISPEVASYVEVMVNNRKFDGALDEFIQISDSTEGQKVSVIIKNSKKNDLITEEINLQSYNTEFNDFSLYDKSKYFVKFYEDYKGDGIIQDGKGIEIINTDESIYNGAIISEVTLEDKTKDTIAKNANYSSQNDYYIKHKKAELKDKIFYMDIFENMIVNDDDDNKKVKDLGDISAQEYKTLRENNGKTPEKVTEYEITPNSLLTINKNVDSLSTGLYINTGELVLSSIKESESPLQGKGTRVMLNDNSSGIIICQGDVYIEGNFNFTGTIITLGNLYVEDGSNVNIYYDDTLVKKYVAMNYEKLKDVFKNIQGYKLDTVKMEVYKNNVRTNTEVPLTIEKWVVMK